MCQESGRKTFPHGAEGSPRLGDHAPPAGCPHKGVKDQGRREA